MKKMNLSRFLLLCGLCITLSTARAQYAAIPDSNFGIWLNANGYSSCLTSNGNNGNWRLDTTCPAVLHTVSFDFGNYEFDCSGIVYFKGLDSLILGPGPYLVPIFPASLKYLYIGSFGGFTNSFVLPDSLTWLKIDGLNIGDSLPAAFPAHMIGFDCSDCNEIGKLPTLPVTLRYLNLELTQIDDSLPSSLPDSLRYLNCYSSLIDYLPPLPPYLDTLIISINPQLPSIPNIPNTLVYLDCHNSAIDSMPPLPATLTYLDCHLNRLGNMPALPASLAYLDCSVNYIPSLSSLPGALTYLDCSENQIRILPALPPLTYLACYENLLHTLPSLPSTLGYLSCGENPIHSLPTLPASLTYLDCSEDSLSALPALPSGLTDLLCSDNFLTALPALPSALVNLSTDNNLLHALPALPGGLINLYSEYNLLTALPTLPSLLSYLDCSYNQLTNLPSLPNSLTVLYCDSNQLTALPSMPGQLNTLSCEGNLLTSLPAMPSTLNYLNCRFNPNLSCLPVLPEVPPGYFGAGGSYPSGLYIAGTGISCVPAPLMVAGLFDIDPSTLPLCTPASGCPFYYNISGSVHFDTAATCAADSLNPGNPLTNIKVNLLQNGQVHQQCYLTELGQYSFKTDSFASYVVQVDTGYVYSLAPSCPSSGSYTVLLSAADSISMDNNFGMACASFDYQVTSISGLRFRPGFTGIVNIYAGNQSWNYSANCGGPMPGTFTTILSGPVQYTGPATGALTPTSVSVSGDTLVYSINDIDSLIYYPDPFDIMVATDTNANLDSSVCITCVITPSQPDVNINDDTLKQCIIIRDSYDPNNKSVYPTTLTPGGWLTYTVEFQNTGNDTAYTVVVRDTLSRYVDPASFQYIASDHKAVIQLFGNAMVFTFPKINLVDSATNPPLSTGWIQYKVKAKTNLPSNAQVANTAYIYFDINPAVVTNTTVNTVDTAVRPSGINRINPSDIIHLYPNPNKGTFTLQTSNSINSKYTITDMLGHVITEQTITTDRQAINMTGLGAGVYVLTVKGMQPLRFTVVR